MVIRDVEDAVAELQDESVIGIDIETSGLSWYYDEIMVVSLYGASSDKCAVLHVKEGIPSILQEYLSQKRTYIFHNGVGFDVLFFKKLEIEFPYFYDTLVAEQVLDTTSRKDVRKNLGAVMKRRIGKSFKGDVDHDSWRLPELTEEQIEYAANDVRYLPKLMDIQTALCAERGLSEALNFEMDIMPEVVEMQYNGLEINVPMLKSQLEDIAVKAEGAIASLGSVNPNSPVQVKAAFDRAGLPLLDTRVETLQEVILGGSEGGKIQTKIAQLADAVLIARKARKRTGMYDNDFVSKYIMDGRLHFHFWQLGTSTTRFSSSNPNGQQIPRDLRSVIGNNPGFKVVAGDYSQIEIRILASLAEDEELAIALESEDFHSEMAHTSFGIPIEELDKETRQHGKAVVFTWTFLGGANAVVQNAMKYGVKMETSIAAQALSRLKKRFYKTSAFQQEARDRAKRKGAVNLYLPVGHRRTLIPGRITPQAIINTLVQGSAAVGMKYGIKNIKKRGLMKYVGATVHDEIVASGVPDKEAEEYGVALGDALREGMEKVCEIPVKVEVKIGDAWS